MWGLISCMHCIPKLQAIFSGHRQANSALLLGALSISQTVAGKDSGGTGGGINPHKPQSILNPQVSEDTGCSKGRR